MGSYILTAHRARSGCRLCWKMLPQMEESAGLMQNLGPNLSINVLPSKNVSTPEGYSSAVWLVLFFVVISLSIIVNTVYTASLLFKRNLSMVHFILAFFFLINLLDYSLLIFEFYADPGSHYPYSETSCTFYQFILQGKSLLCACTLIFLVYHTFISTLPPPQYLPLNISSLFVLLLIITLIILSVPSLLFSRLAVYPDAAQYCIMDLSSLSTMTGSETGGHHALTAICFLTYKSMLTYWIPLLLIVFPIAKLTKLVNTLADKQFIITITIAVSVSFLVFHFPLAATVITREFITIFNISVSSSTKWTINVFHSLSLLISYFFHVFRPLVCLVVDQDSIPNLCRRRYRQVEKGAQENDQV